MNWFTSAAIFVLLLFPVGVNYNVGILTKVSHYTTLYLAIIFTKTDTPLTMAYTPSFFSQMTEHFSRFKNI